MERFRGSNIFGEISVYKIMLFKTIRMSRTFRILKKAILFVVSFVILIVACLVIFYFIESNRIDKSSRKLLENPHTRLIQGDTADIGSRFPLNLIPVPQKVMMLDGFYQMPENPLYSAADTLTDKIEKVILNFRGLGLSRSNRQGDIVISYMDDLPSQGYRMEILPGRIAVEFSDTIGLHYAFVSLKVLNQNHNGLLPCAMIEDYPDLKVRGLMLDISRDKIPSVETLIHIAQLIADLKYNHLQLYVEGFSFGYPSFEHLWKKTEMAVTIEQIRKLDEFCRANYIDLVPNQNLLGHMATWLATEEYADLTECPQGFRIMSLSDRKSTIDPSDPGGLELVKKFTDDMIPAFTSDKFNANLDEPFEPGKGKNKKGVKEIGLDRAYLEYAVKVHELLTERGKEMLMWSDILLRHPESLDKLPRDITLLDRGYEASYPFEKNSQALSASGLKFMLCPGTSSWNSITGRTNNMLGNIASAASNAVKFGAEGILITDWGDMGHWQYLPVSYAGYVAAGALSWNSRSIKKFPLTTFLNDYVFQDSRHIMAQLALDLGRYIQFEEYPVPNMTSTMLTLQLGLNDRILNRAIFEKISAGMRELMNDFAPEMVKAYQDQLRSMKPFDYEGLFEFLVEKEELLNMVLLNSPDGKQVTNEYHNAITLLRAGVELQYYIAKRNLFSREECISRLNSIQNHLVTYLEENRRLWMSRNNAGGYERTTASLNKLLEQVKLEIANYQKPSIHRFLLRFKSIILTSASAVYLKLA